MVRDAKLNTVELLRQTQPEMRLKPGEDFAQWQKKAYDKLYVLLGLDQMKKCEPRLQKQEAEEKENFIRQRFTFYSEENYEVACTLLLPRKGKKPFQTVICLQGHSTGMHISLGEPKYPEDEETIAGGDRDFAVRAVKEGFAAIAMEQRYMGECGGDENGPGCLHGTSLATLLLGRCAIGERVWDISRLIDVLEADFPELTTEKLICLGNSGGGTVTFYSACMDPRIYCAVPSCSVCTYKDSIGSIGHCACHYIPGIASYFDMGDLAGLIAPRKFVLVSGKEDPIFPAHGVEETFNLVKELYQKAGVPENAAWVCGPEGHRFYADAAWPVIHQMLV